MKTRIGIEMAVAATCIVAVLHGCQAPKTVYEFGDGRRATVEGADRVTFSDRDRDGLSVVTGDGERLKNNDQKALGISTPTQPTSVIQADGPSGDQGGERQGRRDQPPRDLAKFGKETEQVRAELEVAREKQDRLLAEIRVEEARLSERRHEREVEEKTLEESRAAHAGVLGKLEARRSEVEQLQRSAENQRNQIEENEARIAELNAKVQRREDALAELVTARDKVHAEAADAQRDLDALRGEVDTLATEKNTATEAIAVVRAELAKAKEKLAAAGAEVRQREQQLRQLNEARRVAEQAIAAALLKEHLADVVPSIPQSEDAVDSLPPSAAVVPDPVEEVSKPVVIDSPLAWRDRGRWLGLLVAGIAVVGVVILISRQLHGRLEPDLLTVAMTELSSDGSDPLRMQIDRSQGLVLDDPPRVLPVDGAAQADLPWIRRRAFGRLALASGANGEDVNLNGESLNGSEVRLCEGDRITIGQDGSRRVFVVQTVTANEETELLPQQSETL